MALIGRNALSCPMCRVPLQAVSTHQVQLHECAQCRGVWLDIEAFQRLCADRHRQAAVLLRRDAGAGGASATAPSLPCAKCARAMHRFNYAKASGIHLDMCRDHGIWFEGDELRRVLEFVQVGGLAAAQAQRVPQPLEAYRNDSGDPLWVIDCVIDLLDVIF